MFSTFELNLGYLKFEGMYYLSLDNQLRNQGKL